MTLAGVLTKLVTRSGNSRGNLAEVTGSLLVLLSFALPWFCGSYRFSSRCVTGAEILLTALHGISTPPLFTQLALIYLFALPVLALVRKEAGHTWIAALAGIVLLAVMIFLYPARPWHFSAGAVTAGMGLLLMATGFYRARRDR